MKWKGRRRPERVWLVRYQEPVHGRDTTELLFSDPTVAMQGPWFGWMGTPEVLEGSITWTEKL